MLFWIKKYQEQGEVAFFQTEGNKHYSKDFKIKCVEAVIKGEGSVDDIVAKYNISVREVLRQWILAYNANKELKDYDPKREVYMAEARRKTTLEERKEIVEYCINHDKDYKGTAAKYKVSYSQVYSWVKKYKENQEIAELIKEYDDRFGHILGYRRMTDWINHFNHTSYNRKRIHRIMQKLGIHSVIRRKKAKYKKSSPEITAENKLKRDFYASAPNEKWTTDVTEFKIPETNQKLFLSAILDLYDRVPVAYVVSKRNNNKLVFDTYDKAIAANPNAKPLFHSDRGYQYTSKVFQAKLHKQGIEQSMSRVSHCIDNGPTEGLWGIIKTEMYAMYTMYTIKDETSLRGAIDKYMHFYTYERPQERFNCKTPADVRKEAMENKTIASYPIAENKRIEKYKEKCFTK